MDGDGGGPGGFQHLGHLHAVAAAHVPAPADLGRHRNGNGGVHRLHDAPREIRAAHQGGAVAVIHDLPHGAAHVQVDDLRPGLFQGDGGGLRHAGGIAAENLHRRRTLLRKAAQQGKGFFIAEAQGLGGDELRAGKGGALLPAEKAEGGVGNAGHGGQHQGRFQGDVADLHRIPPYLDAPTLGKVPAAGGASVYFSSETLRKSLQSVCSRGARPAFLRRACILPAAGTRARGISKERIPFEIPISIPYRGDRRKAGYHPPGTGRTGDADCRVPLPPSIGSQTVVS